ncbi:MAG: sugar-binding protein [Candidatus Enteromonas sp.]
MKKKLFLASSTALLCLASLVSCGGETESSSASSEATDTGTSEITSSEDKTSSIETPSSSSDPVSEGKARKRQEMPTAEIVDKDFDYGDPSSWVGNNYKSADLGYVYLQDVISDNAYDWGQTILFEDGVYKMWWVRPAVYDSIYYAESTDLKNWVNTQRVICLSPNASNVTRLKNLRAMLGKPSVLHIGDTYYMYFEAPATEDPDVTATVLEWDNQVMLATSKDGIKWDFYCDDKGDPKPIVGMDPAKMGDFNMKHYGDGQPSVFYKDGTFYLTYCHVMYSADVRENGIYLATSKDGFNFGDVSTHTMVAKGKNGKGVTYNTKTGKYMMCTEDSIFESNEVNFDGDAKSYQYSEYSTTTIQRGFPEFIRNPHGLVDTETFYVIHLQGEKSTTDDWRAGYRTWDGYIHAINPCEYMNREITLPNGGAATTENLKGYRNRPNSYTRTDASAAYAADSDIRIDCVKDEAYASSTVMEISRPCYDYGSDISSSWGEAWAAWNEDYLYVFAHVYDSTPDHSYPILNESQTYMHDSLDFFVDPIHNYGTNVDVPYELEQYLACVDSDNQGFAIKGAGENIITDEFEGIRHRVKVTDDGYDVEVRMPWHEFVIDTIQAKKTIGFDLQINDSYGEGVGRQALLGWNDNTGNAFRFVDVMGNLYLAE